MANVSVLNTTNQLSGKTVAVCENDQTVSGAWTFSGNQTFTGNVTIGNAVGDTLTVTSTIVSSLLFTDATYDIGASGATRPRDFFLSRNATVGGTLAVTGVATFTAVPVFSGTAATTFNGDVVIAGTTPLLTIGDAGEEDTAILFDGNAQDYHVGLDDSADQFVIGLGSTLGTTPIMQSSSDGSTTFTSSKQTIGFQITNSFSTDSTSTYVMAVRTGTVNTGTASRFVAWEAAGGTVVGTISLNNNAVAYNTSSDERLKTFLGPSQYGLDTILAINLRDYFWNNDTERRLRTGVSAQQLYSVYPEAVSVGSDDLSSPWAVDYSKLTPPIIKAIQELSERVTDLENNRRSKPE